MRLQAENAEKRARVEAEKRARVEAKKAEKAEKKAAELQRKREEKAAELQRKREEKAAELERRQANPVVQEAIAADTWRQARRGRPTVIEGKEAEARRAAGGSLAGGVSGGGGAGYHLSARTDGRRLRRVSYAKENKSIEVWYTTVGGAGDTQHWLLRGRGAGRIGV